MASETITLFDIPTPSPAHCWSFNTWRTRILLSYKGIEYKTEWVEYPDIRARLEPHVKPDAQGSYTVPTIRFPDGSYLMDSRAIAAAIEERYPSPPIELKPPVEEKVRLDFIEAFTELQPVYVPTVYRRLINEASKPYFRETREAHFGKTLEQVEEQNPTEAAFAKATPALTRLTGHLKENGGPFFEGQQVNFFDIVYAGMLLFFKDMGEDIWGLLLKSTGEGEVHEKFLEAMNPWTKKND